MHAIELKEENVELVQLLLNAGATINYEREVKFISCIKPLVATINTAWHN